MTKEEFIDLLNADLEKEYSAAIQYIQHAAVITGAQWSDIRKELVIHANEEIGHAIVLAEQISFLGGTPTVVVADIATSGDSETMLRQDLGGEEDAVARYTTRIEQAEGLRLYALGVKLREILSVEQEHTMDLMEALGM